MNDTSTLPAFKSIDEMKAYMAEHFPEMLNPKISKFAPKLSYHERCEVMALSKMKFDRRIIAAAYGINRGTLAYIVNPSSPHYRDVRKEYAEEGHDQFCAKYINHTVMERYNGHRLDEEVAMGDTELNVAKSEGAMANSTANPKATKREGKFSAFGFWNHPNDTMHGEVKWFDNPGVDPERSVSHGDMTPRPAGWYVEAKYEGIDPGVYGATEDSKTSLSALSAFLKRNQLEEVVW